MSINESKINGLFEDKLLSLKNDTNQLCYILTKVGKIAKNFPSDQMGTFSLHNVSPELPVK